jgi:hypothetical protein
MQLFAKEGVSQWLKCGGQGAVQAWFMNDSSKYDGVAGAV